VQIALKYLALTVYKRCKTTIWFTGVHYNGDNK